MEREAPRAFHTMQYVQRLSQPSWILMPGRMRPVGVGVTLTTEPESSTAPSTMPRCSSTRAATRALLGSTTTLSAMAASSSVKRLATQPVATTVGHPGRPAA